MHGPDGPLVADAGDVRHAGRHAGRRRCERRAPATPLGPRRNASRGELVEKRPQRSPRDERRQSPTVLPRFSTAACGKPRVPGSRNSRMPTLPQRSPRPSPPTPTASRCGGRRGDAFARVDLARLRGAGRPARGRAPRPRRRSRRPGRAHVAQPARVPRRRHRGAAARRDAGLDLQLLRAGTGASTSSGTAKRRVAIVEDIGFLERFLKVRSELPALRHVVDRRRPRRARAGRRRTGGTRCSAPRRSTSTPSSATRSPTTSSPIIYTSGTTGPPKGVMLDHENMDWTIDVVPSKRSASTPTGWRVVSYLPMAHVAERTVSHYIGDRRPRSRSRRVPTRVCVVPYLVQTRPQFFFAVPRVWEKAHAALRAAVAADPEKAEQFEQALEVGWQVSEAHARGEALPDAFEELWALIAPALQGVRAPDRPRPVRDRDDRRGADPVRDPAVLPQSRRAALGGLRPLGDERADDVDAVPREGRHRRPADSRASKSCSPRTARCSARGGNVFRGYLERAREDRRGVRRRRLVPHRRHRRARRRRLPEDRRPQEGAHHHRGRQEHLTGQPRSRAQGRRR